MVIPDRPKVVTAEVFRRLLAQPENAERLLELVNGEVVEKVPTQLHALIASFFSAILFLYTQRNPIGWVFSELRVKLPDDDLNDRLPDVAFVLKEGRSLDPNKPLTHMPELAIEIQSPTQSDKFMVDRAGYYLENGARMVWIVYPSKRLVEVLTATDRRLLTESDTIDGGDLLPDFSLPVKDIFAQAGD